MCESRSKKRLKGETLAWFELASHLHLSVDRVQDETTSFQFVMWQEYLERDANAFHREDFYLAQIAAEIRRSFVKNPKRVSIGDFILKFVNKVVRKGKMTKDERTKEAKSWWAALTSISFKPKKKKMKE